MYDKNSNSEMFVLPRDKCSLILKTLHSILSKHGSKLKADVKLVSHVMRTLSATTALFIDINSIDMDQIIQLMCLEPRHDFQFDPQGLKPEVGSLILESLLVVNILTQNEYAQQVTNHILRLLKVAESNCLIRLAPLLLASGIRTENDLIRDHLLPALLGKDVDKQTRLLETLPAVVCLALGDGAIVEGVGVHLVYDNGAGVRIGLRCSECCDARDMGTEFAVLLQRKSGGDVSGSVKLFEKFLNVKSYVDAHTQKFLEVVRCFARHGIFSDRSAEPLFHDTSVEDVNRLIRPFLDNVLASPKSENSQKEAILKTCINRLVKDTRTSLTVNDYLHIKMSLECVRSLGLVTDTRVLLPSTKLLVYHIMHPHNSLAETAATYLVEICESHDLTTNQVYHRYKRDYCRLLSECSVYSEQHFGASLLRVLRSFGFAGLVDFVSKDVHHFLPYVIPLALKVERVPVMIEELASLVQCSAAELVAERFPQVYTHVYLHEDERTARLTFDLVERITGASLASLLAKHHRVVLMELLLQYCADQDKVVKALRYLASHDPDSSGGDTSLTLSQLADFLQPRFLGVLAYFDNKLMNARVALSVKRKALQSFPDIVKLLGAKHLTPLRFKVLATLRSCLSLAREFPAAVAAAWSAFVHNLDATSLGPLLPTLVVSLLQQLPHAPTDVDAVLRYLVLGNENLLSAHLADLAFLTASPVAERIKQLIRKHVKRTMPELFLDKVSWYLQQLQQDLADVKTYALERLDELLLQNRTEIHKAVFGGNHIHPVVVQLLDCLKSGCSDADERVRLAAGACVGQLGALEAGLLPRQYVPPDPAPFAFGVEDDCFAAAALAELMRAFQYEKDTKIMDNYALTIQEILKVYSIAPDGSKRDIWRSFPEHVHQILTPLLNSRYFLAYPAQPKKSHPLFGSPHATSFIEWAYNWAGQLIPLTEPECVRSLLRHAYPSMRRDTRTLLLFLPHVLLHAVSSTAHHQVVSEEMLHVIGMESSTRERCGVVTDGCRARPLAPAGLTYEMPDNQHSDSNQLQSKCCKTVYMLIDFLNRWLLEWCHTKHHATQSDIYKSVTAFVELFSLEALSRGNMACGNLERALQQLELYVQDDPERLQAQLPALARVLAALDEPDAVAGTLTLKRCEPTLQELVLAHEVTGRVQDAAFCYERLAQQRQLDATGLRGMVECYLRLDQPFTALRLLSARGSELNAPSELHAEPLWRLGRWEQLDRLLDKPTPPTRENWGVSFGRVLLALRSDSRDNFETHWRAAMTRLLAQDGGHDNTLCLHIAVEARHVERLLHDVRGAADDGVALVLARSLVERWRLRARLVQADVRTTQPLLRARRTLLDQLQTLLGDSHPRTALALREHIGELWLTSAKHARKAGMFQQAYTYILNAEQYAPARLFIEKARMYWARGQREPAFTTLRRGLEETPAAEPEQPRLVAKARLLIAQYNEETSNVDADTNLQLYVDAVDAHKQWEKSLVCLGAYYEKVAAADEGGARCASRRLHALNSYGRALQYGNQYVYQTMPRMLSLWLEHDGGAADLAQLTDAVRHFADRLPLYLFLAAFSQLVSRICHPVTEVYRQISELVVRLLVAHPQRTLWMLMSVIKSSYPQRARRCAGVLADARLKEPAILRFIYDFTQLAEKLIELCNKPLAKDAQTASVRALVSTLPRLLAADNFSRIMMPFQQFCRIALPSKDATGEERAHFDVSCEPLVYIAGIDDHVAVLPSLQHPRKVTLRGSDGKAYIIMLKPKDDLRKDFRLMEFNSVVNRLLRAGAETRRRRLYIRTYSVLPLNEECGVIEWVPNLLGLRPILLHLYKQKGIITSNRELKSMMCAADDPMSRKLKVFQEQLLPRHPPVLAEWYRRVFADPHAWYQARSAYIRTTAVMSCVGYILGLGDRHGENILLDATNGDAVHVDFNCLFNKGESFTWPERVPFRLTHNMTHAMGPLRHEGVYRKCCEATLVELRSQSAALMSVVGPFVYDPLVSWSRRTDAAGGERVNQQAKQHLDHIRQRLAGVVRTKSKQPSAPLSAEGQVEHLIAEAISQNNLCQMYLGWGPFL